MEEAWWVAPLPPLPDNREKVEKASAAVGHLHAEVRRRYRDEYTINQLAAVEAALTAIAAWRADTGLDIYAAFGAVRTLKEECRLEVATRSARARVMLGVGEACANMLSTACSPAYASMFLRRTQEAVQWALKDLHWQKKRRAFKRPFFPKV